MDRTTYEDGTQAEDRPGPFDIEREDVVLARVVDATVPIQPQGSGPAPAAADSPTVLHPPGAGAWHPEVQQADPVVPAGSSPGPAYGPAPAPGYEGYPDAVEGPADRPLRSAVTDGQEWAQSPAAGRRRRMPAFSMARRGFEPVEVEMYLVQQDDALAAATERADTAERQLAEALAQLATAREQLAELQEQQRAEPPASIQALGDRVAQILQQAWDAAEELRAEAAAVADGARAEVDEAVRAAEADARARADDIVAEADRHRRVVLEELASRRAEHDAAVARLTTERATAMADLERIHSMLQRALGPQPSSPAASVAAPAGDAGHPAGEPAAAAMPSPGTLAPGTLSPGTLSPGTVSPAESPGDRPSDPVQGPSTGRGAEAGSGQGEGSWNGVEWHPSAPTDRQGPGPFD